MADNLFGEYIRQRREDAWLTRTELARKANLSVSLIEKIELGTRPPTLHSLQILFDQLDVSPMYRKHILDLGLPGLFGSPPATAAPGADDLADLAALADPASFYTLPLFTIVAANAAHQRTFPGLGPGMSFVEWLFVEPLARKVIVEWRKEAHRCLHSIRQLAPNIATDTQVSGLVRRCHTAAEWDELWNSKPRNDFDGRIFVRDLNSRQTKRLRVRIYSPEYPQRAWWFCRLIALPHKGLRARDPIS
ncbi:XRE family transcriptional regulator [Nocardia yunnanensis]|uniref:XRE family transcriptional regulator n=1 Tax=Nocardia yunnanensis TaxID=2382165 RepID=A0A386ZG54_9NOCA|nr:helix-turn-helix domain-containing protein [Nocardia yunnanensis]AYF76571.1 XRE family transcriptional regulator [Nocardia yunnanensis]